MTIARSHSAVRFPAMGMLVAAMNPTPRGDVAPGEVGRMEMGGISRSSAVRCSTESIFTSRPRRPFRELSRRSEQATGTSTAQMRAGGKGLEKAAPRGRCSNARLSGKKLDEMAGLDENALTMLGQAMNEMGLSARAATSSGGSRGPSPTWPIPEGVTASTWARRCSTGC